MTNTDDVSARLIALRRLRDRVVAWRNAGLLDEETLPAIDVAIQTVAPETTARLIALRSQKEQAKSDPRNRLTGARSPSGPRDTTATGCA